MADVIPLKFVKTGDAVTALSELATGDTIPAAYLPSGTSPSAQTANTFLAGPVSGDPALPTYRTLSTADMAGVVLDGGNF